MHYKNWFVLLFFAAIFISKPSYGHEYAPGLHQWKIKGGMIFVVSGLLSNGMALYVHNYNFYFQKDGEKVWYQIPIVDKNKPGDYELNTTAKAKEERMVRDAKLDFRNGEVFLLYAYSARENELEDSPITAIKYRLVITDGDDWPYAFERISSRTYPAKKDVGVDSILKQEIKRPK